MPTISDKNDGQEVMEASDGTIFQFPIAGLDKYTEVFDNVLRENEIAELLAKVPQVRHKNRNEYHWFSLDESRNNALVSTLENVARRVAELDSIVGIEYWCVVLEKGEKVDWHIDKDESLFTDSGGEKITSCKWSLVCYLDTTDLVGGEIEIKGTGLIEPKVGRCVKMEGSLRHRVKRVLAGRRVSLVLNLWTSIPRAYQLSTKGTSSLR
jgi:2OG-Fe(II) oxygenase superfamily